MAVNLKKLTTVALLGAFALFTGTIVLTLQVMVLQRKQQIVLKKTANNPMNQNIKKKEVEIYSKTVSNSNPTEDIFMWKNRPPHGASKVHAGIAYWNQVKRYLTSIGDVVTAKDSHGTFTDSSTAPPPSSHIHTSLLQASKLGNSDAQHYVAVAQSTGIWLTGEQPQNETLPDEYFQPSPEAMLLWHMAATEGNLEATVAIGSRIHSMDQGCAAALPYYEAASHEIVDMLEAEKHSRGKVNPPMDRHALPEIHMHGGTSSQLQWENKPDESEEALQYYHLLSTRQDADLHAAYTLAQLYHHGLRGVQQNLTKSLFYYELAADLGSWEAAGQAGKFHLWSLGMEHTERNLFLAHKYFQKGAPLGLEGCRERYSQAFRQKTKSQSIEDTNVQLCDHPSVNGLGLLYLYGVPLVISIDVDLARQYFQLAKDMDNMDAAYNLAMLRLGFKSAWKDVSEVDKKGQSSTVPLPAFMENENDFPPAKEWVLAIQDLRKAATKTHLQARHRLGMIHSHGVQIGKATLIEKDCKVALDHFRWIVTRASPRLSQRTRAAYKQYTAGDYDAALVNYIMAAETGHTLSQVNAAFLLDQGVCLHLSPRQCRTASLRYWKAAARSGHEEAALRVGDHYYYGSRQETTLMDIVLFPEVHLVPTLFKHFETAKAYISKHMDEKVPENQCTAGEAKEVCINTEVSSSSDEIESDSDLEKAAQYYRLAAKKHNSARANYNLGFMHEWGHGLKQDFPLAKRHYDLAKALSSHAGFAVQLALLTMSVHELSIKLYAAWRKWNEPSFKEQVPSMGKPLQNGEPTDAPASEQVTKLDVILKHVLSWESLLIIALTVILSVIFNGRTARR